MKVLQHQQDQEPTPLEEGSSLYQAAQDLITAMSRYWSAYTKHTDPAQILWLTDTAGRLIIMTRGEYREALLGNIKALQKEGGVAAFIVSKPKERS